MLIHVILLIVEVIKLLLLMCGCLNYKIKRKPFVAGSLFLLSVCYLVIRGGLEPDHRWAFLATAAILIVAFAVQGKRKVIFTIIFFALVSVLDDLVVFLCGEFLGMSADVLDNPVIYTAVASVNLIVFAVLATVLQLFFYKRKREDFTPTQNVSGIYAIMIMVGIWALGFLCMPFMSLGYEWSVFGFQFHSMCCGLFGVIFLVVTFLLIYNNNLKRQYRYVAEVNKRMYEMQKDHYKRLQEQDIETRKFRHDIKSHIVCVEALLKDKEYEEAARYLERLIGKIEEITQRYKTGNLLVDAIVNDIAEEHADVTLEWEGKLPLKMNISDTEVCVIFSNLLKNAFCAANDCKENGVVVVKTGLISGALTVCIENNMEGFIKGKDGTFITHKDDKINHGFGIMNVKECVAISGGSIEFDYTDTQFKVQVVLPNVV